ncbi:MAG: CotH kinase family protein [Planctomycetes bacterium]|nr:CotH kinase family protein [Planctomycetota bacterium]
MRSTACVVLGVTCLVRSVPAQDLYDESMVRTLSLSFQETNWYQLLTANYSSKTFLKATLSVDGKAYKDVGVRFRGNSSYSAIGTSQKKPFEIALDEFLPGQNLYGIQTLNLNNGFRDPTFVREVIAWRLFRRFVPACRCNYVKLVINNENWGPYINVQQVDKTMLRAWFRDEDGNRYRAERQLGASQHASALTWLGNNVDAYKGGYEAKGTPTNPWVDVRDLCGVLNNTPAAQLPVELPKVLDVEQALRYLAVNNVLPAIDSYIGNVSHNYYLYGDGFHGRFAMLPWDLNASFGGNAWLTVLQKVQLDPFYQFTHAQRPLITRTLSHASWRQLYLAQIRAILDGGYDWPTIGGWVQELQKLIEPELRGDTKRLYSMQEFADNVVKDVTITVRLSRQIIPGLKPMVEGRAAFLRQHAEVGLPAPVLTKLTHAPANPTIFDDVALTCIASGTQAAHVRAYARIRGTWASLEMFDDGKHADGAANDGTYGVVLGKLPYGTEVEYYCGAETSASLGGAMTFEPRAAGHRPQCFRIEWPRRAHAVTINEILASNKSGIRDEVGEREDWIELNNKGKQPIDISGFSLTDDETLPRRWTFPAGTTVPAGGTLLVWADGEPADGPLHATFKLDADGEAVLLFDRDGVTVLDELHFGTQRADVSTGRLFDGGQPWVSYPFSTPLANNDPGTCGYRHYSGLGVDAYALDLRASGLPKLGTQTTWALSGASPSGVYVLLLSATPEHLTLPGFGWSLLVGLPLAGLLPVPADASGRANLQLSLPSDPRLDGARIYAMPLTLAANGWAAGNAIEALLCR